MRKILSHSGGDRATGYAMNNKIVSLDEGVLCTWLDSGRQNQWALVDRDTEETLRSGTIGAPGVDNHCGAALARTGNRGHALIGGHHGPLEHHTMMVGAWVWTQAGEAGERATYPSTTVDPSGNLHVFYRCGGQERWTLNRAKLEGDQWSGPIELIRAHKPGYVYWTNGATTGPDGTMHLAFGNPQLLENGSILYGASHIQSLDEGHSWVASDGTTLGEVSIPAESVPFLGDAHSDDRVQSSEAITQYEAPGPENYNYQQMNLSNPVTDSAGSLHVVLHHNLRGTADLWSLAGGTWSSRPLTDAVIKEPTCRIHPQSSLSIDRTGRVYAVLMVEPTDQCVWGPGGTTITRATVDGTSVVSDPLCDADPEVAQWLPALEHPGPGGLDHSPALLFTRGENAGGFGDNANELKTEVCLRREE
jgi:hypothetical protein